MGRDKERANDQNCQGELGIERRQGKTRWRRGKGIDKWMWTGMPCWWRDGEWVNIQRGMDMDVAVKDLQGRDMGGDKDMGLEVRKTQKRSLVDVCKRGHSGWGVGGELVS